MSYCSRPSTPPPLWPSIPGNTACVRPALGALALVVGAVCCIATIALAVAAKADDSRSIGIEAVILLAVALALTWVGGKLLSQGSDDLDR